MASFFGSCGEAVKDISTAIRKYEIARIFGVQDISQRYRRSRLGVFWLTINMGVMILALGMIFGTILRSNMHEFLPFVCISLIMWGFISVCIGEGCVGFVDSSGLILQTRMPFFTHIMRLICRNFIILMHNILIFPVVLIIYSITPSYTWPLALVGLAVMVVNLSWITLLLATLCARYRDMTQVVQNIVQVFFYVTPIVWQPSSLPAGGSKQVLVYNPFYHLIELVRAPLLNQLPSALNWEVSIAIAVVGWALTLWFFGRYRQRIAYWL